MKDLWIDPKVGDTLIIRGGRRRPEQRVTVTRVARVKFDTIPADGSSYRVMTWRKDTGFEDGCNTYNGPRAYTAEILERERRGNVAEEWLNRHVGIETWKLRSKGVIDPITLANLIRAHLGQEEL